MLKAALRELTPPLLYNAARSVRTMLTQPARSLDAAVAPALPEWQVVGDWDEATGAWADYTRGLVETAQAEIARGDTSFTAFVPEGASRLWATAFAYACAQAEHEGALSVLDHGGQLGRYETIARLALPHTRITYVVEELPEISAIGRQVRPWVTFQTRAETVGLFDLVFASSSLQYVKDWRGELGRLASHARRALFLSRLPVLQGASSQIVRQRLPTGGHMTGWALGRDDVLSAARDLGLSVQQEFHFHDRFAVVAGLEQPLVERGYLFRTNDRSG